MDDAEKDVVVAVCGQHMRGGCLHHQLEELGAGFLRKARTAGNYRLFVLPTSPTKPGLLRDGSPSRADEAGRPLCGFFGTSPNTIEVELYGMTYESFGRLVALVPPPLGFGTVDLQDGGSAKGFLVEATAVFDGRGLREGVRDITDEGTFASYLSHPEGDRR